MKKTVVAVLIIVFIMNSFYLADPVRADNPRLPGVKAGDWAKYAFAFNYSTNDPNMPVGIPQYEGLDYYRLEVLSVVDINVTYSTIIHWRNGTDITDSSWIDVSSGEPHSGSAWNGFVLAANLTAGEKIYLNRYAPTINATETADYVGRRREANCVEIVQNFTLSGQQRLFDWRNLCWDKASGILVTANETLVQKDLEKGYMTWGNIRLAITETNIWKPAPRVHADVFILPRVINVKSKGEWILAFIELPENYTAIGVDQTSIMINNTIPITGKAIIIGKRWLVVRFNRSEVISYALNGMHSRRFAVVMLTITGKLRDGSFFEGRDHILVLRPPKHGLHGI